MDPALNSSRVDYHVLCMFIFSKNSSFSNFYIISFILNYWLTFVLCLPPSPPFRKLSSNFEGGVCVCMCMCICQRPVQFGWGCAKIDETKTNWNRLCQNVRSRWERGNGSFRECLWVWGPCESAGMFLLLLLICSVHLIYRRAKVFSFFCFVLIF